MTEHEHPVGPQKIRNRSNAKKNVLIRTSLLFAAGSVLYFTGGIVKPSDDEKINTAVQAAGTVITLTSPLALLSRDRIMKGVPGREDSRQKSSKSDIS